MSDLTFSELIQNLEREHKKNIKWFWDNRGKTMKWSDIEASSVANGKFARVLKGIYRPKGKDYVLSIKNLIGSEYNSRESIAVYEDDRGGWYFEYPAEENPQGFLATNNGPLMYTSENEFPVGFIYQIQKKPKEVLYKIYGPCLVRYQRDNDIFQLYGFNDNGQVRFLFPK